MKVGPPECEVGHDYGLVLGSPRKADYLYAPLRGEQVAAYHGTIGRIGVDVGHLKHGVTLRVVPASMTDFCPAALAGHGAGADLEASAGLGDGADLLVGGSRATVAL